MAVEKAPGKYTNLTSRVHLGGERRGTPYRRRHSPPSSTPGATGTTGGLLTVPPWPLVPPPRVGKRLRLEVLVKRRGGGVFVQPLDVAGVTEQVVLQRVAAVAVFVIQLQTTVLGEARMSGGNKTKQKDCKTDTGCRCGAPRAPQGRSGRHGPTPGPLATCWYRALETGLPGNEPGCQHTPDPRLRT